MIRGSMALVLSVWLSAAAVAETATVAVASNFAQTAAELKNLFESSSQHRLRLVRGSSGKLYSQIANAAPFDVFLSADSLKPRTLLDNRLAHPGSYITYAVGQLVVWSRDPRLRGDDCLRQLGQSTTKKIAVANPSLAPYGAAAMQYLLRQPSWPEIEPHLVYGENIAQTLQFVATGNASIGLIAKSQLASGRLPATTCVMPVPANLHDPIEQGAVLLSRAKDNEAARAFLAFLQSGDARALIQRHGYVLPSLLEVAG